MSDEFRKDFGFFTQTQGPSNNAVTSITAGDGLTASPNPIVDTGTIGEKQTSVLSLGSQSAISAGLAIGIFPFPEVDSTLSNYATFEANNRTFWCPSDIQSGGTAGRLGAGGLAWGDQIDFSWSIATTCSGGGMLQLLTSQQGVFSTMTGTYSGGSALITCDGTSQTKTYTLTAQRVQVDGTKSLGPRNPASDYFLTGYIQIGSTSGNINLSSLSATITSFSD